MASKRNKEEAYKVAAAWNKAHPMGSRVALYKDDGQVMDTNTRSLALVTPENVPVIFVERVSGYYALDRVKPIESKTT